MAVPAVRYRHLLHILIFWYLAFLILVNEVENQRLFLGKFARLLTGGEKMARQNGNSGKGRRQGGGSRGAGQGKPRCQGGQGRGMGRGGCGGRDGSSGGQGRGGNRRQRPSRDS